MRVVRWYWARPARASKASCGGEQRWPGAQVRQAQALHGKVYAFAYLVAITSSYIASVVASLAAQNARCRRFGHQYIERAESGDGLRVERGQALPRW
ncbi:MAG: hypothetical protein WKG07_18800 [Hymenobacter sp.]